MSYDLDGRRLPEHAPFPRSKFAPPSPGAVGVGTRTPRCHECRQPLVYIRMAETGSRMPCDPTQRHGDGRRHLVVRFERHDQVLGRLVTRAPADVLGFEPHWGTCVVREAERLATERTNARDAQTDLFEPRSGGAA